MQDRPRRANSSPQLRKDLGIFFDGGFLLTLGLVVLLAGAGAAIMIAASSWYGIPPLLRLSP